jgi:hypothetical protein
MRLMVINRLKSVNDAVSPMYKPATRRVAANKNDLRNDKLLTELLSDSQRSARKNG